MHCGCSKRLPAAGSRSGTSVYTVGSVGDYWSSTPGGSIFAYYLYFSASSVNPANNNNRYNGRSVRLVQHPFPEEELLTELFLSYYSARSNKRNTCSQIRFERDLSRNLIELWEDIASFRYQVGRSMCFIINRPVKREVFAASFRDRIVHHLLYRYLMPIFEPTFIYDSYSCRVGKGTLFGINRLEHHIRSVSRNYTQPCYVLKLDILGYFMSMDRTILYKMVMDTLRRKGRTEDVLFPYVANLLPKVIFNDPTHNCYVKGKRSDWVGLPPSKSLFHAAPGCGLPIGNLTSQLLSNIYLNGLDQFVKRDLQCCHYGRYVDDFYLVDSSPEFLLSCINPIRDFLASTLHLTLHPRKLYLQEQSKGVPFLGCVLRGGRRSLSRRAARLMRERLLEVLTFEQNPFQIRAVLNSYRGHVKTALA
ncbi:MAG: RNA-directed DNA polymerase [Bacteroidales bacterium]|nr:RNA-directed DNA polymerase [Bacteroidales bacterium]